MKINFNNFSIKFLQDNWIYLILLENLHLHKLREEKRHATKDPIRVISQDNDYNWSLSNRIKYL